MAIFRWKREVDGEPDYPGEGAAQNYTDFIEELLTVTLPFMNEGGVALAQVGERTNGTYHLAFLTPESDETQLAVMIQGVDLYIVGYLQVPRDTPTRGDFYYLNDHNADTIPDEAFQGWAPARRIPLNFGANYNQLQTLGDRRIEDFRRSFWDVRGAVNDLATAGESAPSGNDPRARALIVLAVAFIEAVRFSPIREGMRRAFTESEAGPSRGRHFGANWAWLVTKWAPLSSNAIQHQRDGREEWTITGANNPFEDQNNKLTWATLVGILAVVLVTKNTRDKADTP